MRRRPLEDKFWEKVKKTSGCWNWTGSKNAHGYGMMMLTDTKKGIIKVVRSHQVSWFLGRGVWPTKHVLHHCDNPACVKPDHLYEGTAADNMRDMWSRGRHRKTDVRGELNPMAKLTRREVSQIRGRYVPRKVTLQMLADEFGVSMGLIGQIVRGKIWL